MDPPWLVSLALVLTKAANDGGFSPFMGEWGDMTKMGENEMSF